MAAMPMEPLYIVAADTVIDGVGDLDRSTAAYEKLRTAGRQVTEFEISASHDGWGSALPENTLRCACSLMLAINQAKSLIAEGGTDAIVIHGRDFIKTDFAGRKAERNHLLEIYGEGKGQILDGYDKLAHEFLAYWNIEADDFRHTSEAIFDNHLRVWQSAHGDGASPGEKWYAPITDLFRGVDCANPSVDFEGAMVVVGARVLREMDFGRDSYCRITGSAVEQACEDSLEATPEIVPYKHLAAAFANACREAGIDFKEAYFAGEALLEVYTCYPVVPMGFLLSTGFVEDYAGIIPFAQNHPLTVTGGLNLAKAPWNNTTLQAFAEVTAALQRDDTPDMAGIHSVGALGYLQAFALLERVGADQLNPG